MNNSTIYKFRFGATIILFGIIMSGCEQPGQPQPNISVVGLNWQWQYDDDDRLTEIKAPGGIVNRFSYSEPESDGGLGLISTIETGSEKRSFKWDQQGRLLSANGPEDEIIFLHNTTGLLSEIHSYGTPTLQYDYDLQGRLTETRIGEVANIGYRYDYLGRPATIVTPVGDITYDYHRSENMVLRRLPNGIQSVWKYDGEGKLASLTHVDKESYIIAKYVYSYRPDNLIKTIKETNQRSGEQTCRYEYDLMQRLSSVDCGKRTYAYRYDSLGNLIESEANDAQTLHFTNTPAGAIESDSRGVSETDQRGHIRKLPHAPTPIDYEFNDSGMLVSAVNKSLQYSYNALGLLKTRSMQGEKTSYLPDPFSEAWRPLWRRNSDGTEDVIVWGGAVPLVEIRGKEAHYRLEDHLGSVRIETNRRGKITAWQDYSPYGMPENAEPNNDLIPAFTGHFWDPVAKTYLTKARTYDPITARFLQPDPKLRIPDASKHNHSLYAYATGDPVNFVDRNGAEAVPVNPRSVWWNAYWKDARRHLFDTRRAKDTLADYSDAHLRNTQGSGTAAGLTATMLDVVGGYIPGEGGNEGQALASAGWSLALGGISLGGSAVKAVNTVGYVNKIRKVNTVRTALQTVNHTRTVSSAVINSAQGNFGSALLDVASLGGASIGLRAENLIISKAHPLNGDLLMNYVTNPVITTATKLQKLSDAIATIGYSKLAYTSGANHILRKADDFLVQPAYGNEILMSSNWMPPSPVGGVYLGGAGKTLEGMGQIKGVSIDETTGKLVLIGSGEQQISLPPLRLDDIVTIFRAVYDHGQSPSVTIDPDEENPQGPTMDVKHGPGTEGTYVGWILFECDRIMKTYQLGQDNVSKEAVISKIAGYKDMLDAVYFGGDVKVTESQGLLSRLFGIRNEPGQNWERFWIVPASVSRFDSDTSVVY